MYSYLPHQSEREKQLTNSFVVAQFLQSLLACCLLGLVSSSHGRKEAPVCASSSSWHQWKRRFLALGASLSHRARRAADLGVPSLLCWSLPQPGVGVTGRAVLSRKPRSAQGSVLLGVTSQLSHTPHYILRTKALQRKAEAIDSKPAEFAWYSGKLSVS